MATKSEVQLANERFFDWLDDGSMKKEANDMVNDFTRTIVQEDSFAERFMPSLPISYDELDKQYHTDKPFKVVEKQPGLPPAITVPYGTTGYRWFIRGPKYGVSFCRILSPTMTGDIFQLRTWDMDIRQVLSDMAVKDMLAEADSKFIAAVNSALIGLDSTTPTSGSIQWKTIGGGITRETVAESLKIMPSTPFRLESSAMLINNVTIYELYKWFRDEVGGDFAQDLLKRGWTETKLMGRELVITIKRNLVPDNNIFYFADPKFIGKTFELQETTAYVERKYWRLEWFMYREMGGSIGHTAGLARAYFG